MPDTRTPPLAADDIRFAVDWLDRDIILVPDDVARRMERERLADWHEQAGFAYGESRKFLPGTWMYDAITTLMAVFAASPVPAGLPERDTGQAAAYRDVAGKRWHLWPSVVGVSDFDDTTRRWRDYPGNSDLHVGGSASRCHGEDAFRIAG